ncbi:hypothetical protein P4O66_019059 [Electrophorus voltai]|uniref:AIG1-type G domain-containing protein n=1 Tax=Electrophorus voltai TaxID=2609070 RepID=A0AAD8YR58_9TELE|nr:hypothetical protein P4O66_019059 [Electrophorus voltai]
MILFTYKDNLKQNIQHFLENGDPELQELVAKCRNHYHCLNNTAASYRQFKELLGKIEEMVAENEGRINIKVKQYKISVVLHCHS